MGLKLQCLEGYGRIPMYGRIRARNPKFTRKKTPEFWCLKKEIKIVMF